MVIRVYKPPEPHYTHSNKKPIMKYFLIPASLLLVYLSSWLCGMDIFSRGPHHIYTTVASVCAYIVLYTMMNLDKHAGQP